MSSSRARKPISELSKLQLICSLFNRLIGDDLYYAKQIQESIDAALPQDLPNRQAAFLDHVQSLAQRMVGPETDTALGIVDLDPARQPFSLLALRFQLLEAIKRTCRYEQAVVILNGLKEAICPKGRRWTRKRMAEYEDAITFARRFCSDRSLPSHRISIVIF